MSSATSVSEGSGTLRELVLDDSGIYLAPGRHKATVTTVRRLFVEQAPYRSDRELIWEAFGVYHAQVLRLLPSARFWVDGGFVTHKDWAAPKDVDVCLIAQADEIAAAGVALMPLLTDASGATRIQPMGGLVDSFITVPRPDPDCNTAYWAHQWSRVQDLNGNEDASRRKGYVEVIDS
jgi:hypothetical protein